MNLVDFLVNNDRGEFFNWHHSFCYNVQLGTNEKFTVVTDINVVITNFSELNEYLNDHFILIKIWL